MRLRRFPFLLAPLAVIAAVALAGCGGEDAPSKSALPAAEPPAAAPQPATDAGSAPTSSGAPIPGGGLSIDEALASTLSGPLMVKGFLVGEGDSFRLCGSLAESMPPQCGGNSLDVLGLDPASLPDPLASAGDTSWSEETVSLLGEVRDGSITISPTAIG